ncbi:hypothetical protein HY792_00415 [Candidatus Desantisbacteria bacterium]|nr:hypothetical protein [Candidatus Desantisbacteria bacterium]
MKVTSKDVAQKLTDYLYHRITLRELVNWAELMMMEAEFDKGNFDTIRDIISRLGLADVKTFGIAWEDCEEFLSRLGYQVKVSVQERLAAA